MSDELLPCPFCGAAMQLRYALWPSEGDTDAVIHNVPGGTDCPIEGAFTIGTADEGVSVAEAWNRRASPHGEAGATVKPLEWQELTEDRGDGTREPNGDWEAPAPFGFYEIEMVTGHDGTVVWGVTFGVEEEYIGGDHASPDAAKAAAQADYEARIRSALTPSVETGRVTDAMRDRLERMRDLARTHAKMTNPPVSHEFQADADALEAALSASPGSSAGAVKPAPLVEAALDEQFGPGAGAKIMAAGHAMHSAVDGPDAAANAAAEKRAHWNWLAVLALQEAGTLASAPPQREGLERLADTIETMEHDMEGDNEFEVGYRLGFTTAADAAAECIRKRIRALTGADSNA